MNNILFYIHTINIKNYSKHYCIAIWHKHIKRFPNDKQKSASFWIFLSK